MYTCRADVVAGPKINENRTPDSSFSLMETPGFEWLSGTPLVKKQEEAGLNWSVVTG